ncbi:MAG: proline dehydrogenase family protein [Microscillaceae bacterium]
MANQLLRKVSFEDTSIAFSAKSDAQLRWAYRLFGVINRPWLVGLGTASLKLALRLRLPMRWLVKPTVFAHFCGGETIEDCRPVVAQLQQYGIGAILDYSVEGEKSEEGFEKAAQEIKRTILKAAGKPKEYPFCVFKMTGLASFDLMAKRQSAQALSQEEEEAWQKAFKRVEDICQWAYTHDVRIFIDAEETWIQQSIDAVAYAMMRRFNREKAIVYNTYQLYTRTALENLRQAYAQAQSEGYRLGAKLVRGAYMEKERARAEKMEYPDPIQPTKAATDRDYNEALRFCLQHYPQISFCAGTHNEASSQLLAKWMQQQDLSPQEPDIYFAQLYGMSDHISYNLAHAGFNVAKYVPYGPVEAVMPYLMRRAAENTSVAGQSSREFSLLQRELRRRKVARRT